MSTCRARVALEYDGTQVTRSSGCTNEAKSNGFCLDHQPGAHRHVKTRLEANTERLNALELENARLRKELGV